MENVEEEQEEKDDRIQERKGRGCSNTVGDSSIAREGVAPLPAEQNARRLLSTAAAISCSQCPKFIGDSKLSSLSFPSLSLFLFSPASRTHLTTRRGLPHLPTYLPTYIPTYAEDRSISRSLDRPFLDPDCWCWSR